MKIKLEIEFENQEDLDKNKGRIFTIRPFLYLYLISYSRRFAKPRFTLAV